MAYICLPTLEAFRNAQIYSQLNGQYLDCKFRRIIQMSTNPDAQRLRAFVIGPIGDRDADDGTRERLAYENGIEALEHIITPACKSLDIEAFRADGITRSGEIPEQVFRHLRDSHIVIADLTEANPNVMYELGLRHTTGKLTIQIGERNRLPFDISTIRTILFKRTEAGFIEARRSLIRTLAEGLESGGDPVTATRIWFEINHSNYESTESQFSDTEEPQDDSEEPGFLELIAATESGIIDIGQTLATGNSILGEISRVLEDGTAKINALPTTGNYSAAKLAVANRIAAALEDPALKLRIVAQDYTKNVEQASPGMIYMLQELNNSPEQLQEAGEFPTQIKSLVMAATGQMESVDGFIDAMHQSGSATRSMRKVAASIVQSTEKIRNASSIIAGWRHLLDEIGI